MEKAVREWNKTHQPIGTKKNIQTYTKQFHEWCARTGARALPADPETVARFIMYCATDERGKQFGQALSKNTIAHSVISAISNDRKDHGMPSPTDHTSGPPSKPQRR